MPHGLLFLGVSLPKAARSCLGEDRSGVSWRPKAQHEACSEMAHLYLAKQNHEHLFAVHEEETVRRSNALGS